MIVWRCCFRSLLPFLVLCIPVLAGNWQLAQENADTLRFSTLFTAHNVRQHLQTDQGLDDAVTWCRACGITKVYLESFRGGYLVPLAMMRKAADRFTDAGFQVSGCITTVGIGRKSVDGWIFPCFTEPGGLENLKHIFEYTAMQFDEIMIDDFFATRCQCDDCLALKGERSWADMRCDMMVDVSKTYVIDPVRRVNSDCSLIIKYPQWYGDFQVKGYDVKRQTAMFDQTWVGTETRDPNDAEWGRHPQYMAYFIMRWLGVNGGMKCGGGWFDPYGTSPETYVEQARQTVLGGAREAVLFCYGSLQEKNGPANIAAFQQELPQLFRLAALIRNQPIRGVHAPKPPNSEGGADRYMYDFMGMLGLPLVPAESLDPDAESAVLGLQVLADPKALQKITAYRDAGTPVLLTQSLMDRLPASIQEDRGRLQVLPAAEDKWDWMDLDPATIDLGRDVMLQPLGIEFCAPSRVALYLFGEDLIAVENFNDRGVDVQLGVAEGRRLHPVLTVKESQRVSCRYREGMHTVALPPRTLVVLK
jgi:hypothetical protein